MAGPSRAELVEVMRCATGLVRTAHPSKITEAVVMQWWDALLIALIKAHGYPGDWQPKFTDPDNESRCP